MSLSARGRRRHRHPDGRAKSTTAIKHDRCFDIVAGILECLVKANGAVLISVENPRSPGFLSQGSLRRLASQPGWRLVERTDYCKNADCCAGDITVFQNQVPNSKGRAVIHSEELPPESQANYRPSRRPITARVTDQLPPARRGPRSGQPGSPAIIPDLAD